MILRRTALAMLVGQVRIFLENGRTLRKPKHIPLLLTSS